MIRPTTLILCACVSAAPAFAQQPAGQSQRRGGLLPDRAGDPAGVTVPMILPQTRDELARRWDINADGRIDEAEAELARSKMRRERQELLKRTEIDPLTGRPRGAPAAELPVDPPSPASMFNTDPSPTLDPRNSAQSGDASGRPRSMDGASAEPADESTPPKRDLNAGRLPGGLPAARGTSSLRAGGPARSAPAPLPPRRSGAILLPPGVGTRMQAPTAPAPAAGARSGVPARPTPATPARPRITAEEMGVP